MVSERYVRTIVGTWLLCLVNDAQERGVRQAANAAGITEGRLVLIARDIIKQGMREGDEDAD